MTDRQFEIDTQSDGPRKPPTAPIPMPGMVQVERLGNALLITRRWICGKHVALAFFAALAIITFGAFIFHVFVGIPGMDPMPGDVSLGDVGLLSVFTLVIAALSYWSAAMLINKSYLRVDDQELQVRHGPLPVPGSLKLPINQIRQLFCAREQQEAFGLKVGGAGGAGTGSASYMYVLNAVLISGRKIRVLAFMMDADQARFIEQQLESHLGIEDRKVPGELPATH